MSTVSVPPKRTILLNGSVSEKQGMKNTHVILKHGRLHETWKNDH